MTTDGRRIRVLLADDHATVRDGLRMILGAQPDMQVVGEAGDGLAALGQARALTPDVVVMDVSMPGTNGVRATEAIRAACPQVRVLGLTRHSDEGYLQQLLRAGGGGYVLKQSPASELVRAIRAVDGGGCYLDPAVAGRMVDRLAHRATRAPDGAHAPLSAREREVLSAVAWGYSNKEIAARLDISVKTVETHKANAMSKLELRSRSDVVRHALAQGWLTES